MLTRRKPLRSKTPLKKGAPIERKTPIRKTNPKRKRRDRERCFGEEAKRVRETQCCVTAHLTDSEKKRRQLVDRCSAGKTRAAHVVARGMGNAKGDRFDLVPLCDRHHEQAGEAGTTKRAKFEVRYGWLDLRAIADRIAIEHPEALGIRGLARRWAAWRAYDEDLAAFRNDEADYLPDEPDGHRLADYERKDLLGWVRRRMARTQRERQEHDCSPFVYSDVADDLGLSDEAAYEMCEAAGWTT